MKAIVFGGTGFIGSHVVEQLRFAGHQVTAIVREKSNITFLEKLGVNVVRIDFDQFNEIRKAINGYDVVYNCTADTNLHTDNRLNNPVEITLTKMLIEAASMQRIRRFIQLSTIVVYDFKSDEPMDETYQSNPEFPIQKINLEREKMVQEKGKNAGMETIILRPASTIGKRDTKSFFSRVFTAYMHDQYPMVGNGDTRVSLIDTRDIGRAMEWLGTYRKSKEDNGIYVLKGFDTTWLGLMEEIERATGRKTKVAQQSAFEKTIMVKNLSVNRIWNDSKIKELGFHTRYTLHDAVTLSVHDLLSRV